MGGYSHLTEADRQALAELSMMGVNFAAPDELRRAGVLKSGLPPAAFGMMPTLAQSPVPRPGLPQSPWLPTEAPAAAAAPPTPTQPNGLPDLSGAPAFGRRGFAAGLEEFGPGILGELAPFAAGPVVGRAMQVAPRLTLAGAGWLTDPSKAGGAQPTKRQPSDAVRALQRDLSDKGYDVELDGISGPKTEAAKLKEEAKTLRAEELALEREKSATARQAGQTAATAATTAATTRAEQAAAAKRATEKLETSRAPTLLEEWGPLGATFGGLATGYGLRTLLGSQMSRAGSARAGRAEEMTRELATPGDVPTRVGRVNEFWTTGGASRPPFSPAPNAGRPHPWEPNARAPGADRLYQPGPVATYGPATVSAGLAGAEAGISHAYGSKGYEALTKAEDDFKELSAKGATDAEYEAAIQRILRARQQIAVGETGKRFGIMQGVGGLGAEAKSRVVGGGLRPRTTEMEGEWGRLVGELAPPPPASAAAVPHWVNQPRGQPGNRGQFRRNP